MSGSTSSYRDRIYIVKDIILKLVEYGKLNRTTLAFFCGLNLKKHKSILDELELNDLISRSETQFGKRVVTVYSPTQKGGEFCRTILEPYETMFPRRKDISLGQENVISISLMMGQANNNNAVAANVAT